MKKYPLWLFVVFALVVFDLSEVQTQVTKNVIVEHFTNTRCPICANRNPGFYSNLRQQPEIICISIHPSAPYNTCPLSQANRTHNDARTNYYGIYGATPRLVVNGEVISAGRNYGDPALFDPYSGMSPIDIKVTQSTNDGRDFTSRVVISRVSDQAPHGEVLLFAGLVEDTVYINGGNGEPEHYNVLRRSLYSPQGMEITLPQTVGDSIVFEKTETAPGNWNYDRMKTVAILQSKNNKATIQSFISSTERSNQSTTSVRNAPARDLLRVYPNPAKDQIILEGMHPGDYKYDIMAINGQRILSGESLKGNRIEILGIKEGLYLIRIYNKEHTYSSKIWVSK